MLRLAPLAAILMAVPMAAQFESERFVSAAICSDCHSRLYEPGAEPDWEGLTMVHQGEPAAAIDERSIAPFALWSASMMAHAAVDPYWQAKVRYETATTPEAAGVIENACLSCHAPMQQYEARSKGGLRFDSLNEAGRQGVSCTVCHQIDPANLGTAESFTAGFKINDKKEIYGPQEWPFYMPMQMHTGRSPTYSKHILDSALCGTCHTVITPTLDAAGKETGEFLEQATYLEWAASSYPNSEKTCQSCHMPQLEDENGMPARQYIAHTPHGGYFGPIRPREPFGQHTFGGANVQMLNVLADLLPGKHTILRNAATRAKQALDEGLTLRLDAKREGGEVEAAVRVVNSAGHKYPSGFPSRRLWLHLTAFDREGEVRFESGAWNLATGEILALEGRKDAVEPHRDRITSPEQTQIYEVEMADPEGGHTVSLMRAGRTLKDNRLLPLGFRDGEGMPEGLEGFTLAPVGVGRDANFRPGVDTVTYRFTVDAAAGPWTIEVQALYQNVKPAHADVFDSRRTGEEAAFLNAFTPERRAPVVVEKCETTVD